MIVLVERKNEKFLAQDTPVTAREKQFSSLTAIATGIKRQRSQCSSVSVERAIVGIG